MTVIVWLWSKIIWVFKLEKFSCNFFWSSHYLNKPCKNHLSIYFDVIVFFPFKNISLPQRFEIYFSTTYPKIVLYGEKGVSIWSHKIMHAKNVDYMYLLLSRSIYKRHLEGHHFSRCSKALTQLFNGKEY